MPVAHADSSSPAQAIEHAGAIAGHLAAWPALYTVAALVCFAQLAGVWQLDQRFGAVAGSVALVAWGAYLLDRVKLADAFIDPPDLLAQPERYEFLLRHPRWIRWTAIAALVGGAAIGLSISIWAPLASLLAAAGVVAYAARPRDILPRPKDVLPLKNAYVAGGITGFAALAAIVAATPHGSMAVAWSSVHVHPIAATVAAAFVCVHVISDAALCDIDDSQTDQQFHTRTAATRWGRARVLNVACVLQLLAAGALLFCRSIPLVARLAWATAGGAGAAAIWLAEPLHLRDVIDLRFPLEAAICVLAAWLGH